MKGDFSRETFRARRHYSGVLMQQGRTTLDADWNEQLSIALHHLRSTTADVIGWHGTPHPDSSAPGAGGFRIDVVDGDLSIGPGHYYVDGILCENDEPCFHSDQPAAPTPEGASIRSTRGLNLVFLDVWDRHITSLEDASLLEVALGGSDTTTRIQVVWQVRVLPIGDRRRTFDSQDDLRTALGIHLPEHVARLRARTVPASVSDAVSAGSGYRGLENRLYRVEIHDDGPDPLFKWSRTNGSEAYAVSDHDGNEVQLSIPTGGALEWKKGASVELVDDDDVLSQRSGVVTQITDVGQSPDRVIVDTAVTVNSDRNALLRRWDGAGVVEEGRWIELEDGIEISFGEGHFRAGDYWVFPARPATGGIEWPTAGDVPQWVRPRGIRHHYAPLALIGKRTTDLRRFFNPLAG